MFNSGTFQNQPRPHVRELSSADATNKHPCIKSVVSRHLPLTSTSLIHGEDSDLSCGGDTGASQTQIRMVYTTALLFGHRVPVWSEEEGVLDMIGKYLFQLASPGQETSSVRRGSVDSYDETDTGVPCKFFHKVFYSELQ